MTMSMYAPSPISQAKETCPKWSRIAATYALGFIDDKSKSAAVLTRILANRNEDEEIRTHAAEALGHMEEPKAISVMERILMAEDSAEVKKWCIYALSEFGNRKTQRFLRNLQLRIPLALWQTSCGWR